MVFPDNKDKNPIFSIDYDVPCYSSDLKVKYTAIIIFTQI